MPSSNLLIFCAIGLLCGTALSAEPDQTHASVTVFLRDGRSVSGTVDQKTDTKHLWLRRTLEEFDVASGFAWEEVVQGLTEDGQMDVDQLRAWAHETKQVGRVFADIEPQPSVERDPSAQSQLLDNSWALKTLVVTAHVGQWDKDAQLDGLHIIVSPLDLQGRLVPIDGHIEFTLVAQAEPFNGRPVRSGRPEFIEGDRISYRVKRQHFVDGPAIYALPFSKWHPDFRHEIDPQALLHARLSVPGRGVFEASDAQVCLREFSRFRDQLQYFTPGRYLPLESNGQANR